MESSFYAVDYKDNKLGVLDITDKVIEYFPLSQIKYFIKSGVVINGVILDEKINPIYSLDGLRINLAYRNRKKFGKWIVVVLKQGDRFGNSLSCTVKEDTVFFYDSSVDWNVQEYPYGQFVASYKRDTLLNHNGRLSLDLDVPSWTITGGMFNSIKTWLRNSSV